MAWPSSRRRVKIGEERIAAGRVERGGRLIEQQHGRIVDQRDREIQPLLHPAGESFRPGVRPDRSARRAPARGPRGDAVRARRGRRVGRRRRGSRRRSVRRTARIPGARARRGRQSGRVGGPRDALDSSPSPRPDRALPAATARIVLFPDPFGPSRPTISPRRTSSDTPSTARRGPYRTQTSTRLRATGNGMTNPACLEREPGV